MRSSRVLALVALGVLGTAAPARAQFCVAGQFWTCFSFQVAATRVTDGSGNFLYTAVTLDVRNASGVDPFSGQSSWLTALGVYAPSDVGTASNLSVGTTGTVNDVGSAETQWSLVAFPPYLGLPSSLVLAATGSDPKQGNIMGCGTTGGATIYFNTCAPPNTGSVVFSFRTTGDWASEINQFALAAKFQTTEGSFECTSGAPGKSTPSCGVIPEPITMTLLGTGMAGMWGVGLIRRRRKNGDIESA